MRDWNESSPVTDFRPTGSVGGNNFSSFLDEAKKKKAAKRTATMVRKDTAEEGTQLEDGLDWIPNYEGTSGNQAGGSSPLLDSSDTNRRFKRSKKLQSALVRMRELRDREANGQHDKSFSPRSSNAEDVADDERWNDRRDESSIEQREDLSSVLPKQDLLTKAERHRDRTILSSNQREECPRVEDARDQIREAVRDHIYNSSSPTRRGGVLAVETGNLLGKSSSEEQPSGWSDSLGIDSRESIVLRAQSSRRSHHNLSPRQNLRRVDSSGQNAEQKAYSSQTPRRSAYYEKSEMELSPQVATWQDSGNDMVGALPTVTHRNNLKSLESFPSDDVDRFDRGRRNTSLEKRQHASKTTARLSPPPSSDSGEDASTLSREEESSGSISDYESTGSSSSGYSSIISRRRRAYKQSGSAPRQQKGKSSRQYCERNETEEIPNCQDSPFIATSLKTETVSLKDAPPLAERASEFVSKIVEHLKLHQPFTSPADDKNLFIGEVDEAISIVQSDYEDDANKEKVNGKSRGKISYADSEDTGDKAHLEMTKKKNDGLPADGTVSVKSTQGTQKFELSNDAEKTTTAPPVSCHDGAMDKGSESPPQGQDGPLQDPSVTKADQESTARAVQATIASASNEKDESQVMERDASLDLASLSGEMKSIAVSLKSKIKRVSSHAMDLADDSMDDIEVVRLSVSNSTHSKYSSYSKHDLVARRSQDVPSSARGVTNLFLRSRDESAKDAQVDQRKGSDLLSVPNSQNQNVDTTKDEGDMQSINTTVFKDSRGVCGDLLSFLATGNKFAGNGMYKGSSRCAGVKPTTDSEGKNGAEEFLTLNEALLALEKDNWDGVSTICSIRDQRSRKHEGENFVANKVSTKPIPIVITMTEKPREGFQNEANPKRSVSANEDRSAGGIQGSDPCDDNRFVDLAISSDSEESHVISTKSALGQAEKSLSSPMDDQSVASLSYSLATVEEVAASQNVTQGDQDAQSPKHDEAKVAGKKVEDGSDSSEPDSCVKKSNDNGAVMVSSPVNEEKMRQVSLKPASPFHDGVGLQNNSKSASTGSNNTSNIKDSTSKNSPVEKGQSLDFNSHQEELFAKIKEFQQRKAKSRDHSKLLLEETSDGIEIRTPSTQVFKSKGLAGVQPPISIQKSRVTPTNSKRCWAQLPAYAPITGKKVAQAYIEALSKNQIQSEFAQSASQLIMQWESPPNHKRSSQSSQHTPSAQRSAQSRNSVQSGDVRRRYSFNADSLISEMVKSTSDQSPREKQGPSLNIEGRALVDSMSCATGSTNVSEHDGIRSFAVAEHQATDSDLKERYYVPHSVSFDSKETACQTKNISSNVSRSFSNPQQRSASTSLNGNSAGAFSAVGTLSSRSKRLLSADQNHNRRVLDPVNRGGVPHKTSSSIQSSQLRQLILSQDSLPSTSVTSQESSVEFEDLVSRIDNVVHRLIKSGKLEINPTTAGDESELQQRTLRNNTTELLKNLAILRARRSHGESVIQKKPLAHLRPPLGVRGQAMRSVNDGGPQTEFSSSSPRDFESHQTESSPPYPERQARSRTRSLSPSQTSRQNIPRARTTSPIPRKDRMFDSSNIAMLRARRDQAAMVIRKETQRLVLLSGERLPKITRQEGSNKSEEGESQENVRGDHLEVPKKLQQQNDRLPQKTVVFHPHSPNRSLPRKSEVGQRVPEQQLASSAALRHEGGEQKQEGYRVAGESNSEHIPFSNHQQPHPRHGFVKQRKALSKLNGPPKPENFARRRTVRSDKGTLRVSNITNTESSSHSSSSSATGYSESSGVVSSGSSTRQHKERDAIMSRGQCSKSKVNDSRHTLEARNSREMRDWEQAELRKLPMILDSPTSISNNHLDLSGHTSFDTASDDETDYGSDDDSERLERIESMIQELRSRRSSSKV